MTHLWPILALLLLAPSLRGEEKPPALKKLAEAEVKNVVWLAVNGKGTELAVCSGSDAQIREAKSLKLARTHRTAGRRVAFVLDDSCLVVAGVRQTGIELLDRKSGDVALLSKGEPDFVCHGGLNLLAYRKDGDDGPTLEVYDVARRKILKRWEPGAWVGAPGLRGFSGKGVLAGDCIQTRKRDGKTELVDCLLLWRPPFDRGPVLIDSSGDPRCLALAPDGKTAALGNERMIDVWDLDKVKKLKSLTLAHVGGRIKALAYSGDGKRLAALTSRIADRRRGLEDTGEAVVTVYDGQTLALIAQGEVHASPGELLAWFPDGKRLATAGRYDGLVRVWTIER